MPATLVCHAKHALAIHTGIHKGNIVMALNGLNIIRNAEGK